MVLPTEECHSTTDAQPASAVLVLTGSAKPGDRERERTPSRSRASGRTRWVATPKRHILMIMSNTDAVRVGDAGHKGRGVFATKPFRAGERILSFQGRVVHSEDLAGLTAWEREHLGELTAETYQVLPEPRCYLNHACAPNAVSTPDAVYAQRDIAVGEEITVDYRLNAHDDGDVCQSPGV